MITYMVGDIFDSMARTLVNPVNTEGVMGAGLAKEFKARYPEMAKRYRAYCENGVLDIGKLYLYKLKGSSWVLNFPTKREWCQPSKLEYIDVGLRKFANNYAEYGITSIAFPRLGCGKGGLNWQDVGPLMEQHLSLLPITIFIYSTHEA